MNGIISSAIHSTDNINKSAHYHDCHQIIYIKSGLIEITIDGEKYTATDSSLIIISHFEEHSIKQLSEGYDRYTLQIDPNSSEIFREEGKFIKHVMVRRPNSFNNIIDMKQYESDLDYLFGQICKECHNQYPLCQEIANLLFKQIILLVLRKDAFLRWFVQKDDLTIVEKICEDFEKNYNRSYSLKSLAEQFYISESHLSHIFKKNMGISIMNYLLSCRLTATKNLLSKSNLPISEIAEKCGFSDLSDFSRTFKKKVGLTPREFRNTFKH